MLLRDVSFTSQSYIEEFNSCIEVTQKGIYEDEEIVVRWVLDKSHIDWDNLDSIDDIDEFLTDKNIDSIERLY